LSSSTCKSAPGFGCWEYQKGDPNAQICDRAVIEAETPDEAKQIFLHDMDRDVIEWREGDWLGDTDIVEVHPARDDAELTALDDVQQKPRLDDGDTRKEFAAIAGQIHRILEDNDAGKSRVVLDPEDVARLHGIADRLGAMAGVLTPNHPKG
jgi:hypothetical protein